MFPQKKVKDESSYWRAEKGEKSKQKRSTRAPEGAFLPRGTNSERWPTRHCRRGQLQFTNRKKMERKARERGRKIGGWKRD